MIGVTFKDISKTYRVWSVTGRFDDKIIGQIRYNNAPATRAYVFVPDPELYAGISYESLKEIADFCKMRTEEFNSVE